MNDTEKDSKSERLGLMDDILDGLEKKKEESFKYEDYKNLEEKYSKLEEMYNKKTSEYDDLYHKYEDRFVNTVSNYNSNKETLVESNKDDGEFKEVDYIDIKSIF